jgi:putative aldouronate transport system permease protein
VLKRFRKDMPMHLMMLPTVIMLIIFAYIPMVGNIIAFQKYTPTDVFLTSPFVGFANFQKIFTTPGFNRALGNTITISLMKMITGLAVPIGFALLLNEIRVIFVKRTIQTMIYLTNFISWVLMAGIIMNLLSPSTGLVNQILGLFGIKPIFFLGDSGWFKPIVVITNVWKEFGFGTIIYLAALAGVDVALYEAATIDGAGYWKQMRHVTLPGISSTIILVATLSLGGILNAGFDQIFNLMSPLTMASGDILDTLVYRIGIQNAQFSLATAVGIFKSAISCILLIVSYSIAYRTTGYKII